MCVSLWGGGGVLAFWLYVQEKKGKRSEKRNRVGYRSSTALIYTCCPSSAMRPRRSAEISGDRENVNAPLQWSVYVCSSRLEQNAIKVIPAGAFSPYKKLRRMWVEEETRVLSDLPTIHNAVASCLSSVVKQRLLSVSSLLFFLCVFLFPSSSET